MSLAIREMLLIEEPTVQILKDELMNASTWFILPSFIFALCLEYFGELNFIEVVKKLILILVFMGAFYTIHKEGTELSFKASEEILKKVSPKNIFLKSWTEVKVKTKEEPSWGLLQKFAIPNLNDLLGTTFFLMSKVFIWILKLIYSTVYHLTYVFAPITAVLYFFPITRSSMAGTIQSSLWCMLMPIVLVSILAIVGNSIQVPAKDGALAIVSIDHIIWLFGVTLLMLMTPILTIGILRGGGVALSGSAMGALMTNSAMKFLKAAPMIAGGVKATAVGTTKVGSKALLEPSIKEMLRKESYNNPSKEKINQLNQKGGIKNPFKKQSGIDERLAKIGITRAEAVSLSTFPHTRNSTIPSDSTKTKIFTSNDSFNDKMFNSKINTDQRKGRAFKSGINNEQPTSIKHRQLFSSKDQMSIGNQVKSQHFSQAPHKPSVNKAEKIPQKLFKPGGKNEIRNI